jgi:hypothetical protein
MKRLFAGLSILCATALLSGCYVSPDYSYVRGNGYAGSAYYGSGPAVIYRDSYYASPYYYGGYGCCWAPGVTIGGVWYGGGHRYYRGRYYGHGYRGNGWHGGGHGWHGRPPASHGHGGGHWSGGHGHGGHHGH